ncbi:hypothetical protein [Streptomyces sp. Ncost-T10-10d]|uniref:hypothetical protein n=1 Tax=Streptomyces sp. Ncost-T10-10d TaxID=1839774 RepID=UPI00081F24DE|nr:hypothetical protein GA0115254_1162111 [Streptomyces sp. Ncost-T10-10d]
MTESAPAHPDESLPLDSTAQLLTRITAQLGTQLSLVSLNGTRRTAAQAPAPDTARRFTAGVVTAE